jgi:hypothetical protein
MTKLVSHVNEVHVEPVERGEVDLVEFVPLRGQLLVVDGGQRHVARLHEIHHHAQRRVVGLRRNEHRLADFEHGHGVHGLSSAEICPLPSG